MDLRPAREGELELARAIDDDACTLYAEAGLPIEGTEPAFFVAEARRWAASIRAGELLFALEDGSPIGFISLAHVDGLPFIGQLSVRRAWMRRGVGRTLLAHARRWSAPAGVLWLTTYDQFPWNRPYYERAGFVCIDASACGPELRAIVSEERALPAADQRVVMRALTSE